MAKNKDGSLKSQIHLYSTPNLYGDFKQSVKQFNSKTGNNCSMSEILRVLMHLFATRNQFQSMVSREMEIIKVDNTPAGILFNKGGANDGV